MGAGAAPRRLGGLMAVDPKRTVAELVVERPGRSRVFEELGIDYCCRGGKSLAAACAERGLDVADVAGRLAAEGAADDHADLTGALLVELCDHVVAEHHAYLRRELPLLSALVGKVAAAHSGRHPSLLETQELFEALAAELASHMTVEEEVLFPAVRALEGGGPTGLPSLAGPIGAMESDHALAGAELERLRTLNDGFVPPEDACNSYRAMLDRLETLERDLHRHVHEENNVLFPRALALEEGVRAGSPRGSG